MALQVNRINFTNEVNAGLNNNDLSGVLTSLLARRKAAILQVREKTCSAMMQQINNLVSLYQEQLDVLRSLLEDDEKTVRSNAAALFQNEFRITQTMSGSLMGHCGSYSHPIYANFPADSMLVVTELSRKLRALFFQALVERKPLLFYGPAGTGKTESIKDFSKELGLEFVIVKASDKSFTITEIHENAKDWTAAATKYGGNFVVIIDEFNRLEPDQRKMVVEKVKATGALLCATMNPDNSEGFPGNVEEFFGADVIKMGLTIPPYAKIAKVMAATEGVVECEDLGTRYVRFLEACKGSLLSKQHNYDFGLRTIRKVLQAVGSLVKEGKDEKKAFYEAAGMFALMGATKENVEIVGKLMKESFGEDCVLPQIPSHSQCISWWFDNSNSSKAMNVMNCKDADGCVNGVEWTKNRVVIDCDPKDFVARFNEEVQKAIEAGERALIVVKTQLTPVEAEPLNIYTDDNNRSPVRFVLFNNDLSTWAPATVSRIPSFVSK